MNTDEWLKYGQLYNHLFMLGDVIRLDFKFDHQKCLSELEKYKDAWQKYNPRDMSNHRYGLPYTSIDGEVIDPISLDSLRQYNDQHGTSYKEESFTSYTEVSDHCESLYEVRDFFNGYTQRAHFLKLFSGGHFPTHRDSLDFKSFRVLVPLKLNKNSFLYEDHDVNLVPGNVYLVNTLKRHIFKHVEDEEILFVMNIKVDLDIILKCYMRTSDK